MKTMLGLALIIMMLMMGQTINAEETGYREVVAIGCHSYDGECYISLAGDTFGSDYGCADTQARWNSLTTKNGRAILAMLTSAFIAGKYVDIYVDGCYERADGGIWPQLGWILVKDKKHVP